MRKKHKLNLAKQLDPEKRSAPLKCYIAKKTRLIELDPLNAKAYLKGQTQKT